MTNILAMPLGKVKTRIGIDPRCVPPLYDGAAMYDLIRTDKKCTYLWVCTFTASEHHDLGKKTISRLIYCLGSSRAVKKRKFADIHTKLFIAFDGQTKPLYAFVGSQNLVAPTTHNLMVMLNDNVSVYTCIEYFDSLWQQ